MNLHDSVSRRMAGLFVVALALIAWQTARVEPLHRPAYETVIQRGEQLFPIAVSSIDKRPLSKTLTTRTPLARVDYLKALSVRPADAATDVECDLYVRMARHHWRWLGVSRSLLARRIRGAASVAVPPAGKLTVFAWSGADFLDDDDDDGDRLDDGELTPSGVGAEVEVWCRP